MKRFQPRALDKPAHFMSGSIISNTLWSSQAET
jgi:hypothetical protein